jgi:hypothetical protein
MATEPDKCRASGPVPAVCSHRRGRTLTPSGAGAKVGVLTGPPATGLYGLQKDSAMIESLAPENFAECHRAEYPKRHDPPPSPASSRLRDKDGSRLGCPRCHFLQLPDYAITPLPDRGSPGCTPRGDSSSLPPSPTISRHLPPPRPGWESAWLPPRPETGFPQLPDRGSPGCTPRGDSRLSRWSDPQK